MWMIHSLRLAPEPLSDLDLNRSHAVMKNSIHAAATWRAHAPPRNTPRFLEDNSAAPTGIGSLLDSEWVVPLTSGDPDRNCSRRIPSSPSASSSSVVLTAYGPPDIEWSDPRRRVDRSRRRLRCQRSKIPQSWNPLVTRKVRRSS